MNLLAGGFQDPPPLSAVEAKQEGSSSAKDLLKGFKELSEQALHRLQGSPELLPPSSGPSDSARLESGGAASKSDPGSRDFQLGDSGPEPSRGPGQVSNSTEPSTSGQDEPKGSSSGMDTTPSCCRERQRFLRSGITAYSQSKLDPAFGKYL